MCKLSLIHWTQWVINGDSYMVQIELKNYSDELTFRRVGVNMGEGDFCMYKCKACAKHKRTSAGPGRGITGGGGGGRGSESYPV